MKNKTILITGGAGYIGAVLTRQLLKKGFKIKVVDSLMYGGESLLEIYNHPNFTFYNIDFRDIKKMEPIIKQSDIVVHLAAIVGDPACKAQPELAKSINLNGPQKLYQLANKNKVEKFIFSSTCSNYGKMDNPEIFLDEKSKLSPISLYAETKVNFEKFLLRQNKKNICKPTCLRFSTVYGIAPRIRFDLTVNEFSKELSLGKTLQIFGEQFWRPYCHVEDIARAICLVIESKSSKTNFEIFNVGNTQENYTKKMIVNEILKQIPNAKIEYVAKDEDPRDYRVNFEKIKKQLGFKTTKKVSDGIQEFIKLINSGLLNDPEDQKYYNIK